MTPEDVIGQIDILLENIEPIPYSIANSDLNMNSPDECSMIDNYRADDFQRTLMCAKDFIEQYKELHNAVLQYGRNCKYSFFSVCSECPLRYYC